MAKIIDKRNGITSETAIFEHSDETAKYIENVDEALDAMGKGQGAGSGEKADPIVFIGKDLTCSIPFDELYSLSNEEIKSRAVYSYIADHLEESPRPCLYVEKGFDMTNGEYILLIFDNGIATDSENNICISRQGVMITANGMTRVPASNG